MFHVKQKVDVIVIGGGHAGCEAALASARMGQSTLLLTLDRSKIAEMSCNPSIGGVGKGQLTRELDALGGEMGKNADYTGIQFKRLNTRKGSAVQSSRCQSDKRLYAERMQKVIAETANLEVLEGEVKALLITEATIHGVRISRNGILEDIAAESVVITAGTFMRGLMHTGEDKKAGGRAGEKSSEGLSDDLREHGFKLMRLKTGTPPRLLKESIDFSQFEMQWGDPVPQRFSFSATEILLPQVPCYLTYTNGDTHQAIRENLHRSPLYSGMIRGIGPRYCPSIEDKVVKFPDKPRHQLFFEPEALDSSWIYPNGISTSLPTDVQERFVRSIPGCADVRFARFGYAVEYDCIDPTQLKASFESKLVNGLFFAGQVNGTSGYEEAAAQGLMAGINAAIRVRKEAPVILSRSDAYIGVMIDDLITHGVTEPYRMFTSRAEFRLSLREDNADLRLRPLAHQLGLIDDAEFLRFQNKRSGMTQVREFFARTYAKPGTDVDDILVASGSNPLSAHLSLLQILKRPEVGLSDLLKSADCDSVRSLLDHDSIETLEIEVKYEGYIEIQKQEIARLKRMVDVDIPSDFDFASVIGLSIEVREKLGKQRPRTLADAGRVSGVTPAALTTLLFRLRHKGKAPVETTQSI